LRADFEQGLVDAAQIAGAVINQSNHARRIVRGGGVGKLPGTAVRICA
jgi:hypothetical protein